MKDYSIYYHVACMGNWEMVVKEQLKKLANSGVVNSPINVCILGNERGNNKKDNFVKIAKEYNVPIEIRFASDNTRLYELPTLLCIQQDVKNKISDKVLYIHTKGVAPVPEARGGGWHRHAWRNLMMNYLVSDWQNSISYLNFHDIVGVNWMNESYFSGNFWWANSNWIEKLPDVRNFTIGNKEGRYIYECWIGIGNPKVKSFFCKEADFSDGFFWENLRDSIGCSSWNF